MSEYSVKINREQGLVEVAGDKDFVNEKLRELKPLYEQATARKETDSQSKQRKQRPRTSPKSGENGSGKTAKRRSGGSTRIKGLDLAPNGKQSFEEFVAEKQPESQHDKSAVSVYYLTEIADVTPVTSDHVYTCYRDQGWAIPSPNMASSLFLTASKKGFLDTGDLDDITLVPRGTNHVERGLPKKGQE